MIVLYIYLAINQLSSSAENYLYASRFFKFNGPLQFQYIIHKTILLLYMSDIILYRLKTLVERIKSTSNLFDVLFENAIVNEIIYISNYGISK